MSCKWNMGTRPGQERGHQQGGQSFSMGLQGKPQTPDPQGTSVSLFTSGFLFLGTCWAAIHQLSSSSPSVLPSAISRATYTAASGASCYVGQPFSPVSQCSFVLNSTFLHFAHGERNTDYKDPANGFYKLLFSCHRTAFN